MATTGRKPRSSSVARGWAGGFDGKGYEINALKARLEKLPSPGWARRIVIHNTATPDMKRTAQIGPSRYVKNACPCRKPDPLTNEAESDDAAAR